MRAFLAPISFRAVSPARVIRGSARLQAAVCRLLLCFLSLRCHGAPFYEVRTEDWRKHSPRDFAADLWQQIRGDQSVINSASDG